MPRATPRGRLATALAALTLLWLVACGDDEGAPGAYLVLGDSLGAGVGADDPATGGYAPRLRDRLAAETGALPYLSLAWPGLTSATMISRGHLDDAVEVAAEGIDGAPVDLVTVTIGGNDGALLFEPCEDGPTAACRAAAAEVLDDFEANFDEILGALTGAAPGDARLVVMTYYNPLLHPGCRYHDRTPLADAVLEDGEALDVDASLNARIRRVAEQHGALVVETFGLLQAEHLREDCLHPNDAGYAILAEQFHEMLSRPAR